MVRLFILMTVILMTLSVHSFEVDPREKIVVIDTGVGIFQEDQPYMCKNGIFSLFKDKGIDDHGHGTNIIGLIAERINTKTQCIVSIRTYSKQSGEEGKNIEMVTTGLAIARKLHPKFINISAGGPEPIQEEFNDIVRFLKEGTVITVAAGNESHSLDLKCDYFPACYKMKIPRQYRKNFYVISTSDLPSSNRGSIVDAYISGADKGTPVRSGTSQATAIFMSMKIAN